MKGGGNCNRTRVRTASAEGRDVVKAVEALEACNDNNVALADFVLESFGLNRLDSGCAVNVVRLKACLPAEKRNYGVALCLDCHCKKCAGHLLACAEKGVHLTLGCLGVNFGCLFDKVVRCVTLSGNNSNNIIAFFVAVNDDGSNVAYTLGIGNGAAAEFHYYQSHI